MSGLGLIFEDVYGVDYDLTDNTILLGDVKRGEAKVVLCYLLNTDPNMTSCIYIYVERHPTEPQGSDNDSVDVMGCAGSDTGPFMNPYSVGCIVGLFKAPVYIQWSVPVDGNPGAIRVALHTTGVQII